MTFLSLPFYCFFPVTVLVYFLLPQRFKNGWLLLASWFFYLCAKPIYLTLLLAVIVTSYVTGRVLASKRSQTALVACLTLDVILLFLFKYLNFALSLVSRGLCAIGFDFSAPVLNVILPVGISFYLFQAMGYVIDVYRGKIDAEKNLLLYALFLSFFPQVVSGPIGRADELLPQFRAQHPFDWDKLRTGFLRFLWGAFKKLVLADRLAILVDTVYATPKTFGALQLAGAAIAFSLQIYCDFSAYTDMALGVAHSMGFTLRENFHTPYFARSIADFWRRWHISLTSWFRDYLYIPLGGSRKGTLRKFLNILIVFAVSGLWHGAALTFVVWGILNGLYQVVGALTAPARERMFGAIGLHHDTFLRKWLQIGTTFVLSTIAWIFFKAGSLTHALTILGGIIHSPLWIPQNIGWDAQDFLVAALGLFALFLMDRCSLQYDLAQAWQTAPRLVRWLVLWTLLLSCLIFGCYGTGYDAQSFLYGFSF